jgi:hypothetical protein
LLRRGIPENEHQYASIGVKLFAVAVLAVVSGSAGITWSLIPPVVDIQSNGSGYFLRKPQLPRAEAKEGRRLLDEEKRGARVYNLDRFLTPKENPR